MLIPITELEVLRLEKRYAKRSHKSAFKGNASYNDGEYKYNVQDSAGRRNLSKKASERNIKVREVGEPRRR